MGSTENINVGDVRFQGLLKSYLRLRSSTGSPQITTHHLDEDTLSAFTEGNLSQREATPIVSHLADCSFCRHKTAELVRLDLAFAESELSPAIVETREPSKVSEVLSGILSRLFGTGEAAVFAHEEKSDTDDKPAPESDKAPERDKTEE